MKKGIFFDLDGTMWDSLKRLVPAFNRTFRRYEGVDLEVSEEELKKCMGKTLDEIGETLFPQMDPERSNKILTECSKEQSLELKKHGGTLYPKLKETLEHLKEDYGLYIVSNCEHGYIEAFLSYHQLEDIFEDFEYAGRTGKSKGENIKEVIRRNSLDKAVYVGDTQIDLESADMAGIPFIYAAYGFGKAERFAASIDSFEELPSVIGSVI